MACAALAQLRFEVGVVGKVKFRPPSAGLLRTLPDLAALVEPMLVLGRRFATEVVLRDLLAMVGDDRCAGA